MKCLNCGIEFEARAGAKYCSPRCKLQAFRKKSVETDNVTFSETPETDNFEFYTKTAERNTAMGKIPSEKSSIRKAKYWYDVPIAAIPVIQKGWPEMPEFMSGRQYFLWWKNEFEVKNDKPVILNPFPEKDNVTYKPMSSQLGV